MEVDLYLDVVYPDFDLESVGVGDESNLDLDNPDVKNAGDGDRCRPLPSTSVGHGIDLAVKMDTDDVRHVQAPPLQHQDGTSEGLDQGRTDQFE